MLHSISIVFSTVLCSHSSGLSNDIFFVFFFASFASSAAVLCGFFLLIGDHQMSDRATRSALWWPLPASRLCAQLRKCAIIPSYLRRQSRAGKLAAVGECSGSSASECGPHAAPHRGRHPMGSDPAHQPGEERDAACKKCRHRSQMSLQCCGGSGERAGERY